jgi:hypothetical protein
VKPWVRPAIRGAAVAGVLLAVLAVRVVSASHTELQRGIQALARGDEHGAILALRRSGRMHAPGNPYSADALSRLMGIGRAAEARADTAQALAAYRAVRGAILASRSIYVPHGELLEQADARIAALSAESRARGGRTEAIVLAELRAPPRPSLGWTLLLLAGWIAWVVGAFAFAQRALDEEDRLVGRAARVWGTVMVVGFGSWVLGMALA